MLLLVAFIMFLFNYTVNSVPCSDVCTFCFSTGIFVNGYNYDYDYFNNCVYACEEITDPSGTDFNEASPQACCAINAITWYYSYVCGVDYEKDLTAKSSAKLLSNKSTYVVVAAILMITTIIGIIAWRWYNSEHKTYEHYETV